MSAANGKPFYRRKGRCPLNKNRVFALLPKQNLPEPAGMWGTVEEVDGKLWFTPDAEGCRTVEVEVERKERRAR